jgi:HEAT repeats
MSVPDLPTAESPTTLVSLVAALHDKSSRVRCDAAHKLGMLQDTRAVGPLVAMLENLDRNTRIAAATALGELGDQAAVEPLVTALRHEAFGADQAIKAALTSLGASEMVASAQVARAKSTFDGNARSAGNRLLAWGAALLGIGVSCSFGSYFLAGIEASKNVLDFGNYRAGSATYTVFTGTMVLGGILLAIGAYRRFGGISVLKGAVSLIFVGLIGGIDLYTLFATLMGISLKTASTTPLPFAGLAISLVLAILAVRLKWPYIILCSGAAIAAAIILSSVG